jgi:hypothetical protein
MSLQDEQDGFLNEENHTLLENMVIAKIRTELQVIDDIRDKVESIFKIESEPDEDPSSGSDSAYESDNGDQSEQVTVYGYDYSEWDRNDSDSNQSEKIIADKSNLKRS